MKKSKWFPLAPTTASDSFPHHDGAEDIPSSISPTAATSKTTSSMLFRVYSISCTQSLLLYEALNTDEIRTIYLSGHGRVTLINGQCSIFGYTLELGKSQQVTCSPWMPSFPIECSAKLPSKKVKTRLKTALGDETFNLFKADSALIDTLTSSAFLIYIEGVLASDMEWMLQAERFQEAYRSVAAMDPRLRLSAPTPLAATTSVILYTAPAIVTHLALDSLFIHGTWKEAADQLHEALSTSPRVLFCGAKGAGKSSCLRYHVNRASQRCRYIAVLDCDVGQPEYTTPGVISLVILRNEPSLVTPHLNLKTPLLSFFIGDVVTKNEPDFLLAAVRQLFSKYESLRAELEKHGDFKEELQRRQRGGNGFAALELQHQTTPLPLFINADGWIKGLGADILQSVMSITAPTHVMHLTSQRNKELVSFDQLSSALIFSLEPGRASPSKILAADVRLLRFVSAFLRRSVVSSVGVVIKSGCLVDPDGEVAAALQSCGVVEVGFDEVDLCLCSGQVAPRLLLAAVNASLVGLCGNADGSRGLVIPLASSEDRFTIHCRPVAPLTPCSGVALVRAVDVPGKRLLLIPSELTELPETEVWTLVKAGASLPMPLQFMYIPGQPCAPYLTCEMEGEGSASMKARTNVKRKWHNNGS